MKRPVYKDHFCDSCEDFVNMTQVTTHFEDWHSSSWKCLSCGCLTHITEADHEKAGKTTDNN